MLIKSHKLKFSIIIFSILLGLSSVIFTFYNGIGTKIRIEIKLDHVDNLYFTQQDQSLKKNISYLTHKVVKDKILHDRYKLQYVGCKALFSYTRCKVDLFLNLSLIDLKKEVNHLFKISNEYKYDYSKYINVKNKQFITYKNFIETTNIADNIESSEDLAIRLYLTNINPYKKIQFSFVTYVSKNEFYVFTMFKAGILMILSFIIISLIVYLITNYILKKRSTHPSPNIN